LDVKKFDIQFEKECVEMNSDEIHDFYIQDKTSKKVIIGMNQVDLWGGGSQTNRGYKYIFENKLNTQTSKLLCIVCKDANIKLNKGKIRESKKLKILGEGFKNDTLCYLGNLKNIIYKFFDMAV